MNMSIKSITSSHIKADRKMIDQFFFKNLINNKIVIGNLFFFDPKQKIKTQDAHLKGFGMVDNDFYDEWSIYR